MAADGNIAAARPSAQAWYALGVLVVAIIFGFIDRQILSLVAEPMKHDLALRDIQIGEIQGFGPALFTAIATVPLAWLADRTERHYVLFGCVVFWSVATAACGMATSFGTLFVCTVGIAIGEAALTPIAYSFIPDLFPVESRPRANIIFYAATVLGSGLGLILGGGLIGIVEAIRSFLPASLHALAAWRLAFIIVAIPGPFVAIAVWLIGATRRTATTKLDAPPAARIDDYLRAHGVTALGVYAGAAFFSFAMVAVSAWLPIALIRTFHAKAESVGVSAGLVYMASAVVGMSIAAAVTPYWRRVAGTAFVLRALAVASLGAAVPAAVLGFTTSLWQAYAATFLLFATLITGTALSPGMLQDMAPSALRARAIAVGVVLSAIVGSISPIIVGKFSDAMTGNPRGLIWALSAVAVTGLVGCGVLCYLMEARYRRTVAILETA